MSLSVASSSNNPANTPLTLEEAKQHIRIDDTANDAYIQDLIHAVTSHVEGYLGRTLITTTYSWHQDRFPGWGSGVMFVPRPKLQSVESITYVNQSGDSTTWGSTFYTVDTVSQPGRIQPAWQETWPIARRQHNAITVKYDAGYGDDAKDVPMDIRRGMLFMLGHLYENRQDVVVGTGFSVNVPKASEWLIDPHRIYSFEGF